MSGNKKTDKKGTWNVFFFHNKWYITAAFDESEGNLEWKTSKNCNKRSFVLLGIFKLS